MRNFLNISLLIVLVALQADFLASAEGEDEKIKCVECDSGTDSECATEPESLTSSKFECEVLESLGCFTKIDGTKTIRGCLEDKEVDKCKENDLCMPCLKEKCNNAIYPTARIQCVNCENKACTTPRKTKPCVNYEKSDKCFLYVKTDSEYLYGCKSDADRYKKCENDKKFCDECSKSECNDKPITIETKCVDCDSSKDEKCYSADETKACEVAHKAKTCTALLKRDTCAIYQGAEKIIRGCSSKDESTKDMIVMETCEGELCNKKCLSQIKQCYTCESKNQKECAGDPKKEWLQNCKKNTPSCYHCVKDEVYSRGCGILPGADLCNYCYGGECNAKKPLRCHMCDGTLDCAAFDSPDKMDSEICAKEGDFCVTLIKDDKKTYRGCSSRLLPGGKSECTNEKLCEHCDDDLCNKNVYPANRIKCFKCDECDTLKDHNPRACLIYDTDDKCYTYKEKDHLHRGCISDDETNSKCTDSNLCRKCNADGCNKDLLRNDPKLKCITCNNKEDSCAWAFDAKDAKSCTEAVQYPKEEECFTYRKGNDFSTVERGCVLDSKVCENSDNCDTCKSDGCNKDMVIEFKCIQCRSDNDKEESCAKKQPTIDPKKCRNPVTLALKGCYTENDNGVIIRGCLADQEQESREKCLNEDKKCKVCQETGCNSDEPPNGSGIKSISIILLFVNIITVNLIRF